MDAFTKRVLTSPRFVQLAAKITHENMRKQNDEKKKEPTSVNILSSSVIVSFPMFIKILV